MPLKVELNDRRGLRQQLAGRLVRACDKGIHRYQIVDVVGAGRERIVVNQPLPTSARGKPLEV